MEDLTKLKELVIQEANNLKANATKEELDRLDFENLDYNNITGFIYLQMCGDCFSYRAHALLKSCAIPYSHWVDEFKPIKDIENKSIHNTDKFVFSALERYIHLQNAKNRTLIKFLKGEIEELTINDL